MAKINTKITIVLLVLFTLTGCCKTFCGDCINPKPQEVYKPVYSCPSPPVIIRPIFLDVKFSDPLDINNIVGLDEKNYKNLYINYFDLLFYTNQLEKIVNKYKEEQKNVGKPVEEIKLDAGNVENR